MNTKQIFDVKKGNRDINYLYLGNKLVWKRPSIGDSSEIPDYHRSELKAFYTKSAFFKRSDPYGSATGTGLWYDRVSGKPLTIPGAYLSDGNYSVNPAVRLGSGSFTIPVDMPNSGKLTYYIRMRVARMSTLSANIMTLWSAENVGLRIDYSNGSLSYLLSNSANGYTVCGTTDGAHDFHTFALTRDGNDLCLYRDGVKFYQRTYQNVGTDITFISTPPPSGTDPVIETVAVYEGVHSDHVISEITYHMDHYYPYHFADEDHRTYLYNYGDEAEALTGGWSGYNHSQGIFQKQDNCIMLEGQYPYSRANVQTNKAIDLTPYKKIYFKIAASKHMTMFDSDQLGTYFGYKTEASAVSSLDSAVFPCPETVSSVSGKYGQTEEDASIVYLDISKVNRPCHIFVSDCSNNYRRGTRIYSVWLV